MRRSVLVAGVIVVSVGAPAFGSACASDPGPVPAPVAAAPPPSDADAARLCQVTAEVLDATARLRLRDLQARYEKGAKEGGGREARFGAIFATQNDQDRFHAFHAETTAAPHSAVGPLGECFVYAEWKMADQAQAPCAAASRIMNGAAIVDVARASLKRRTQQLAAALVLVDNALTRDGSCAAAHMEAARVHEAAGDKGRALVAWQKSLAAWSGCGTCAVEAARLTEALQGRDASVSAWERALAVAPDHPEALKRYGAALAGKDDAKALAAYEKAIAAGMGDAQTWLGAAQLARSIDVNKAIGFAERAVQEQKNDVDAWRLLLALAQTKGDAALALRSAREVLRLVEEDVASHLVVARAAKASGDMVGALGAFDQAARAIAAGRIEPLDAAALDAARTEHQALLKQLQVKDPGVKGSKEQVVTAVRKTVQTVFAERLKQKKGLKGAIDVNVTTVDGGSVTEVAIEHDTLADAFVAASVVGNLRRATIVGGAKRYGFTLEFQ